MTTKTTEIVTIPEIVLSDSASKALLAALDKTLTVAITVADALRKCFKELLPALPWNGNTAAVHGAKAEDKWLPEVEAATRAINKALLACERYTIPGEKEGTVKLSDSIRNQIGQAKSALGLPKRKIDRKGGKDKGKGKGSKGNADADTADTATLEAPTAAQMELAEWSPDVIRHTIAQCIIALCDTPAGKDAVTEHVNRALVEAGCGELTVAIKPAPKAETKEDRKEMLKRLHEMQELQDKLAAG